ncbi:MAB_1171c family putative transporter [Streptomyces tritici]|uniref:MAB_1171c family putative transporter n=1 Tax=Streptomyces tritici TaxID=2054410 RepID=UPI003AF01E83
MTAIRPYEVVLLVPLWSLTAHTARRALRSRGAPESAPSRLIAGVIALVTLSVTVGVPVARRAIDEVTGMQSITNLLSHLLGMSAIACLTGFVRRMSLAAKGAPRRRTGSWLPLPAVAATMCAAFFLTPRPSGEQYFLTTGRSTAHTVYWSVFLGYVILGVATVGVLCLRHHRQAPPGPLRTSLNLIGAGALTALAYVVHRCLYLALRDSGIPLFQEAVVVPTTQALLVGSLLLAGTGIAWPALAGLHRARSDRRRLRRLEPLWRTLTEAVPEVVLPLPPMLRADPELMLYRYAVEISDAVLALDPFRSTDVEAAAREALRAHGFSGTELAAATEAVVLRCALARARAAQSVPPPPPAPEPSHDSIGHGDAPLDCPQPLAAFFGHPHVLRVTATLLRERGDDGP